jgi:hypothetical protein
MGLPDLSLFCPYKNIDDVDLDGVVVPGLSAGFHRRAAGGRVETVGVYRYAGVEVFMAWGYVGEAHCRFTAFHEGPAGWGAIRPGCPDLAEVTDRVDTLRTLLAGPRFART